MGKKKVNHSLLLLAMVTVVAIVALIAMLSSDNSPRNSNELIQGLALIENPTVTNTIIIPPQGYTLSCSLEDINCETGQVISITTPTFNKGEVGDGLLLTNAALIPLNMDYSQGTIEFWVKPNWNGDDLQNHVFFDNRLNANSYGFVIYKHGASNSLLLYIPTIDAASNQYAITISKDVSDWIATESHFIRVTYEVGGMVELYIDGEMVGEKTFNKPPQVNNNIILGSFVGDGGETTQFGIANSVIDELKIADFTIDYAPANNLELGVYSFFNKNRFNWPLGSNMEELSYNFIDAATFVITWKDIQPTENTYDWTLIDNVISTASANNKKVNLGIFTTRKAYLPDWLVNKPDFDLFSTVTVTADANTEVALPWNNEFRHYLFTLIKEMGNRYDDNPNINYILITGGGTTTGGETTYTFPQGSNFLTKFQEFKSLGYSEDVDRRVWKDLIDEYARAFPKKHLALNPHFSYPDTSQSFGDWNADLAVELIEYSEKKYSDKIIFINTFGNVGGWLDQVVNNVVTDNIITETERLLKKLKDQSTLTIVGRQTDRYAEAAKYTEWNKIGSLGKEFSNADKLNMQIVEVWAEDIVTPWAPNDFSIVGNCFDELAWAHYCFRNNDPISCNLISQYNQVIYDENTNGCTQYEGLIGDVNFDKIVNRQDVDSVIADFGKNYDYYPANDINKDHEVDIYDVVNVARRFS